MKTAILNSASKVLKVETAGGPRLAGGEATSGAGSETTGTYLITPNTQLLRVCAADYDAVDSLGGRDQLVLCREEPDPSLGVAYFLLPVTA